ncbi:neuronal acetylcholine receptor subunit non-alpha-2-like [Anticarsia gemmatalis]|uniref:neuronal acetylcholine receptor subunit non-alpha-2-like n=1 Tax=Anticarsia gemmatalis TaxID=129554 RepID=UPI003F776227
MASLPTLLFITLLFCLYGSQVSWCQCHNSTDLSIRLDGLLAGYERDMPPPNGAGLIVYVTLDVRHATVDQDSSEMRLLTDLKMTWEDGRLRFNQTEWGCDYAIAAAERLWLPDIVLLNAAATGMTGTPGDAGLRARIEYVGAVTWVMRLDLTAPITMNLYDWPTDTQNCTFKFGSRAYGFDEIEMRIADYKHATVVFENGSWEIKSIAGDAWIWYRGEEQTSVASWNIAVSRRAPAHAAAAAAVLVAAALMILAALALPPDQRHTLAACASFTSALWLISALSRMPGGASCPRVMSVLCALCACGALCGAAAALVRRVARVSAPPPRHLRTMLSSLSTVCRLTPSAETCSSAESGAWAAAALLLDRVLCAALCVTVLVLLAVQLL